MSDIISEGRGSAARLRLDWFGENVEVGMTDTEALELDARPDAEIVGVLVDNHRSFLRFLERRVGDRALAEDILQDAFVRGLGKAGSIRQDDSTVAWFYRTLRNAVIDHHRRAGVASRTFARFADELAEEEAPADLAEEVCGCVVRLADTLKAEYAQALKEIDVEGLSVKVFAERHRITPSNAAVRVFRARQALRKRVASACGTCAEHGCYQCSCGESATGPTPTCHR